MQTIRSHDESGQFCMGFFYRLTIPLDDGEEDPDVTVPTGTVIGTLADVTAGRRVPILYAEVVANCQRTHGCPSDPTHTTGWTRENVAMDIFGGPYISDFVCNCSLCDILVSDRLRARLLSSGLTGFSFSNAVPIACNQARLPGVDLFILRPEGRDCARPFVNQIPRDNRCPFCGWEPVVCPACRRLAYTCEQCKQRIVVFSQEPGDPNDPRFLVTPLSDEGLIVDGKNWDGRDFLRLGGSNEMIVTRRVVDWLLKTKSVPFVAEPCRLDVTGMTRSQLRQLESMKRDVD